MFHAQKSVTFTLDTIKEALDIDKRKIYDIINVLTSLRFIRRVSKGRYKWNSTEKAETHIFDAHLRKVPNNGNQNSLDYLATHLLCSLSIKITLSSDSALELFKQRGIQIDHVKAKKIVNVLRILVAIGIAEAAPIRNFTVSLNSQEKISQNIEILLKNSESEPKNAKEKYLAKRTNPQIINMNELINRDRMSTTAREQIEVQRRKNSFENRQVMENYIRSGSIILPRVKIPCREHFEPL